MSEFEKRLEELQAAVDLSNKLDRLYQVPEFKELILDGYLKKEPERLTELLGGLSIEQTPRGALDQVEYIEKVRKDCLKSLEAIGCFHTYIRTIFARGDQSQTDLQAYREIQGQEGVE